MTKNEFKPEFEESAGFFNVLFQQLKGEHPLLTTCFQFVKVVAKVKETSSSKAKVS